MAKKYETRRLISIGLAALYNRKEKNAIKYIYRAVGNNKASERYSFRWQPTFYPNNNEESEYVKKRLWSWTVKERSDKGLLPESTTKLSWPKKHRNNKDWRAAHYFWSWRINNAELRMDSETEDIEKFMAEFEEFYSSYFENDLVQASQLARSDLLGTIARGRNQRMENVKEHIIIRNSNAEASDVGEESLIYLAPHVAKKNFKETPSEKQIMDLIRNKMPPKSSKSAFKQLDVPISAKEEAKLIRDFIKANDKEIIHLADHVSEKNIDDLGAGAEVTQQSLTVRFGKELPKMKDLLPKKNDDKNVKRTAYSRIVTMINREMNKNPNFKLAKEASNRFYGNQLGVKQAAGNSYTFNIPTGRGDILSMRIRSDQKGKYKVTGFVIPNTLKDMGTSAVTHMLDSATTKVMERVIDRLDTQNSFTIGNALYTLTENKAKNLLYNQDVEGNISTFAPTYHTNVLGDRELARHLNTMVSESYGHWYSTGSWQDAFDVNPPKQSSTALSFTFKQWAQKWVQKSMELTAKINTKATGAAKKWWSLKVSSHWHPYSWAAPVHVRPFVYTSKRGLRPGQDPAVSARGKMKTYKG